MKDYFKMDKINEINNIKKNIILVSNKKSKGHLPSAFSIVDFVYMFYKMGLNVTNEFILSKGHACLALYSVLENFHYIKKDDLFSFGDFDSILGGHPHIRKHKEIKASTGSLGHGLPIAVGKALASKIDNKQKKFFCLIGDGEANEGTTWESALLAAHLKLNNLVCIFDNNFSQLRSLPIQNTLNKFISFGWNTFEIDGHDLDAIESCLKNILNTNFQEPTCIILNTKKGNGIKEMEDDIYGWHHKGVPNELLENFLKQLA